MRLTLAVLLAAALLAGCTAEPAPATDPEPTTSGPASAEAVAAAFAGSGASDLPALRFTAGDYNSTVSFAGDFPSPNTCVLDYCAEQTLTFELTPQIPSDAPVDLTITIDSETCVSARLRIEDGDSTREVSSGNNFNDNELGLRIVRSPTGVVSLVLWHCQTLANDPTATTVPVSVEVRTAVRPTVLPTYVPVALDLQPGDRLLAMGGGLDDVVVVPPGGAPVHLLGPFEFNVSADAPAGKYLVVALGDGEAMLHGTAAGMRALPLRWASGERRPLPSGQELTWDFEVPGVPLWVYVNLQTHTESGGATTSASALGDHEVVVTQQGSEVLREGTAGCLIPCALSLPTGYQSWTYWSGYLPESLRSGPLTVSVTNTMAQGFDAYESYGYVQP